MSPLIAELLLQVLVTYGTRVLAAPPSGDPYGQRYKGIWCSLMVLTRALGGNYVNFGVFDLYGDPALKVPLPVLSDCKHLTVCLSSGSDNPQNGLLSQLCQAHDSINSQPNELLVLSKLWNFPLRLQRATQRGIYPAALSTRRPAGRVGHRAEDGAVHPAGGHHGLQEGCARLLCAAGRAVPQPRAGAPRAHGHWRWVHTQAPQSTAAMLAASSSLWWFCDAQLCLVVCRDSTSACAR